MWAVLYLLFTWCQNWPFEGSLWRILEGSSGTKTTSYPTFQLVTFPLLPLLSHQALNILSSLFHMLFVNKEEMALYQ